EVNGREWIEEDDDIDNEDKEIMENKQKENKDLSNIEGGNIETEEEEVFRDNDPVIIVSGELNYELNEE
ncbi:MAG: hypothetical protein EZS28_050653, partial [Streblomastix strix]